MSKFSEYLKLIPLGLKNPEMIIEGILNNIKLQHGNLPEDVVDQITKRRLICAACPFMSENAKKLTGFKTKRKEEFCILCSCPIISKTAAMSSTCGAEFWNKNHPNAEQLEVKWLPYDNKDKSTGSDKDTTGA